MGWREAPDQAGWVPSAGPPPETPQRPNVLDAESALIQTARGRQARKPAVRRARSLQCTRRARHGCGQELVRSCARMAVSAR